MSDTEFCSTAAPTKGQRVKVTERRNAAVFTGFIADLIPPNTVSFTTTFRVRRDEPIVVNGFARPDYWADADELEVLSVTPSAEYLECAARG